METKTGPSRELHAIHNNELLTGDMRVPEIPGTLHSSRIVEDEHGVFTLETEYYNPKTNDKQGDLRVVPLSPAEAIRLRDLDIAYLRQKSGLK